MCHEQWHPNRVVMGSGELPSGGKNDETIARSLSGRNKGVRINCRKGGGRAEHILTMAMN